MAEPGHGRASYARCVEMLRPTPFGLVSDAGGFHIDPVAPVPIAVVTHAHRDHLAPGSGRVVCAAEGMALLKQRLGPDAPLDPRAFGEVFRLGAVDVSLHPSGHVLGSAQVRLAPAAGAGDDAVWVVSGDYKTHPDPTCAPFELVPCDVFVTEATFALPIYRWPPSDTVIADIMAWVRDNRRDGRTSVLLAYALGKAQRLIASLAPHLDEPMLAHGAVVAACDAYRDAGVTLPAVTYVDDTMRGSRMDGRVVMAPPSALGSPWMKRFPRASVAMVSGWMRVRGRRRWKGVDRGFVLSDHADWPGLLATVAATGARRVLTMHGYADVLARHLREQGLDAEALEPPSTLPS
jgi:putative mRNA 3-end processing factor